MFLLLLLFIWVLLFCSLFFTLKKIVYSSVFCFVLFFLIYSVSYVQLFMTPWTAACQASLSFTTSEFAQIHVHWVGDAIQPCHPPLPPSPFAFHLSQHHSLFNWVALCIRWPKYWSLEVYKFKLCWQVFTDVLIQNINIAT